MSPCLLETCLRLPVVEVAALVPAAAPLLFALARQHALPDPEEFTFQVLRRAIDDRDCWVRSGLPARVWLCGLALQMARPAHAPAI